MFHLLPQMLFCPLAKIASSTWGKIFLVLSGKVNISDPMDIPSDHVHHKYGGLLTHLSDFSLEEIQHRLDNYFKFMVVREPLGRLVSAFRNKFETAGYFTERYGRQIIQKYRRNPSDKSLKGGHDVQFSEFVQYLVDPGRKEPLNNHWMFFHERCHPCLVKYDFVGKLSNIESDSQYILNRVGVGNRIRFPSRTESKYWKKGADDYLKSYFSKVPKKYIDEVIKLYGDDMLIYNYTVPNEIKENL